MDREAWPAAIHGVAKSQTWVSKWTELGHSYTHLVTYSVAAFCAKVAQYCGQADTTSYISLHCCPEHYNLSDTHHFRAFQAPSVLSLSVWKDVCKDKILKSESVSHSVVSDSLWPHGLQPTGLLCPWNSPGENTRVGNHSVLQVIFLTKGSNPGLLHCRQILYRQSHQGSPKYPKPLYKLAAVDKHLQLSWMIWNTNFEPQLN